MERAGLLSLPWTIHTPASTVAWNCVDLVQNAPLRWDVPGELRIVSGLVEGNVNVVPGSGLGEAPAVLICPGRGVGKRLTRLKQLGDGGLRLWGQALLGDSGDDAMPQPSPRPGRHCDLQG